MMIDAWLPISYSLPNGSKIKTVLHEGINWQIASTEGGGCALVIREFLAQRWIDSGLIERERLQRFAFGHEQLLAVSIPSGQLIAPVNDCRSPNDKTDALAFAAALKATRSIDRKSPLQDAIYIEPVSRLLPTYTISALADDAVVLGYWLTGGVPIPVHAFRRLNAVLSWLSPKDLKDIVEAAGFETEVAADERRPSRTTPKEEQAQRTGSQAAFVLPGRPALAAFLREHVVDIVENKNRYQALGIGFPSAIVLHGPPGCGKTFAVERLVEYLGWPSFHIDASSVASPYIHETSRKVAALFEAAAQNAPSVLVFDEMEAFLAERDVGSAHHRVEEVAEFLRRIPEAANNEVLIVAMTNRLDMIDAAILRRGRFDHIIEVGPASEEEINELFATLLAKLPKDDGVDIGAVIRELAGRPLSDVAFVIREGARLAARNGSDRISQADLLSALKATPARNMQSERRIGFV
jgi:hypothetical protein